MSEIKLFQINNNAVSELQGESVAIEKSLQNLIEQNLEAFLGIRFVASEYSTGKTHGGRIDTLGIDENGCPVIIEYKHATNQNVINQGLFYLDWLLDHKAEFQLRVMEKFDKKIADEIEWSFPRLLCIAGDFTKYDSHAVQQINRNIELIKYRKFGDHLLLFELVNASSGKEPINDTTTGSQKTGTVQKTIDEIILEISTSLRDRFDALKEFLLALGDDVQIKTLKYYIAFKRIKNFASVVFSPQKETIYIYTKVNIENITLEDGFTRDVSNIGHYGTGDLEIRIKSDDDLEKAKHLLLKSYENN
jgi:predicted transport protein